MASCYKMLIEALVLRQLRPLPNQLKGIANHRPRLLTKTVTSCVKTTEERNILKTARILWCDRKELHVVSRNLSISKVLKIFVSKKSLKIEQ